MRLKLGEKMVGKHMDGGRRSRRLCVGREKEMRRGGKGKGKKFVVCL